MILQKFLFIVLFTFITINAQKKDPDKLIEKVRAEFEKVEDYSVDVTINVDVKFLKIGDREAKIYYKKPDKIFVESEGFALLPKQGLDFSPLGLLSEKYTALFEKEEELNGVLTSIIKIIPLGNNSDIILSTLWIDESSNLILKIESSRKPDGTIKIEFDYTKVNEKYFLPSKMVFTFNVDKVFFPSGVTGELNSKSENKNETEEDKPGKVTIYYNNYVVNQGLTDQFFEEKNKVK